MTIDEIVTLIQAVSDNGLTSFVYEEGNQKLILKKKKEEKCSSGASCSGSDFTAGSTGNESGGNGFTDSRGRIDGSRAWRYGRIRSLKQTGF